MVAALLSPETSAASRAEIELGFVAQILNDPKPWFPERAGSWPVYLPDSPDGCGEQDDKRREGHGYRAAQELREARNTGRLLDLAWALRACRRANAEHLAPGVVSLLIGWGAHEHEIPFEAAELARWAERRVVNLRAVPIGWRRPKRGPK